jgi:membrane AbrB-like protein
LNAWRPRLTFWAAVALSFSVAAALLSLVGAPSPYLFAGAVAGCACALLVPHPRHLPEPVRSVGLAVIGVTAGSHIDRELIDTVAQRPVSILGGVVATVVMTMFAGLLLRLARGVDGSTALLASIAGGASGVTAMARELRADEPVVLTIQYLRVFVVLISVPFITEIFGAHAATAPRREDHVGWAGALFAIIALTVGLVGARILRFTSSRLMVPLAVSAALGLTGWFGSTQVPQPILEFGYGAIGLGVGLAFTPAALQTVGRLLPLAVLQLVVGIGGCAGIGLLMALALGASPIDGYLATTPGGLPAVTAVAVGSGADVGFVVAVQSLRVVVVLLVVAGIGVVVKKRHGNTEEG